jgi:hypothetical protein
MRGMPIHSRTVRPGRGAIFALTACAAIVLAAILLAVCWLPASVARAADLEAGSPGPVQSLPGTNAAPAVDDAAAMHESETLSPDEALAFSRLLSSGTVSEWDHVLQVVAWLRYRLPQRRVVYLFGGSAARESIVSESSWKAQLMAVSGKSAVTYVVSSRCQTFPEDLRIVNQLPKERGVALISVGTTRFSMLHKSASVPSTSIRTSPPGPWYQHHYDGSVRLTGAEKRQLVRIWVRDRYGVFLSRYPDRLVELDQLVQACKARGLRPVLLEMPLNLPVIGHAFDDARVLYQRGCMSLAAKYEIKYLRFVSRIGLRGSDFYDLQHLLPSGRSKWQARLSRELVWNKLLQ